MNTSRNIKTLLVAFLVLFALLAAYLVYIIDAYGDYWFASPYNTRVAAQESRVTAGDVRGRNGETLASSDDTGARTYVKDDELRYATAHALGDNAGQTIGAQSLFAKYLLGFDADPGTRLGALLSGEKRRGADVSLTIDPKLCQYAYSLLDGRAGAIIVMNYKIGEVLALTSAPSFDLMKIGSSSYEPPAGSLVNRATMGRYTPGSTFKIITAIAALRYLPNAQSRTFSCTGVMAFEKESGKRVGATLALDEDGNAKPGYVLLRDAEGEAHGELTLEEAFAHSCNNIFAGIALELGADKLKATAEELGLNGELNFGELVTYTGTVEKSTSAFELAWSGVGQHTDIMTPMHMCLLVSAIANDGVMMTPRLLYEATTAQGAVVRALESVAYKTLLKGDEAAFLHNCMRAAVKDGTGTRAQIEGYTVCGKTGTAEVSASGNAAPHAWFTGFIEDEAHPYAICVVIENGGGGGTVAAPVAQAVLKKAIASFGD